MIIFKLENIKNLLGYKQILCFLLFIININNCGFLSASCTNNKDQYQPQSHCHNKADDILYPEVNSVSLGYNCVHINCNGRSKCSNTCKKFSIGEKDSIEKKIKILGMLSQYLLTTISIIKKINKVDLDIDIRKYAMANLAVKNVDNCLDDIAETLKLVSTKANHILVLCFSGHDDQWVNIEKEFIYCGVDRVEFKIKYEEIDELDDEDLELIYEDSLYSGSFSWKERVKIIETIYQEKDEELTSLDRTTFFYLSKILKLKALNLI